MARSLVLALILFYTHSTLPMNLWYPFYCVASFIALAYGAPNGDLPSSNSTYMGDENTPRSGTFDVFTKKLTKDNSQFEEFKERQEALEERRANEPLTSVIKHPKRKCCFRHKPKQGPYSLDKYGHFCQLIQKKDITTYTKCDPTFLKINGYTVKP